MSNNKISRIVLFVFLSVPILSSLISTIHLVTLFDLGNQTWISYILAITFEIGAITSFLILSIYDKVNKTLLWIVFFLLTTMQIVGNIFFSYDFIFNKLLINPNYLDSFNEFLLYFGLLVEDVKILLSVLIGLPIPLISLFFLKSMIDYVKTEKIENDDKLIENIDNEIIDNKSIENNEQENEDVGDKIEVKEDSPKNDSNIYNNKYDLNVKTFDDFQKKNTK